MTCPRILFLALLSLLVGTTFSPALADPRAFDSDGFLQQQQRNFPGDVIMAGSPNPPVEYLIICPAGFTWQIAIAPLVNFHLSRGTHTGVRFVDIPVTREEIKSIIRGEYDREGGTLRYVLLVGDANEHEYPSYWGCPCQNRYDIIPMAEYVSKDDIPDGRFSRWSHYVPTDWPYVDFDFDGLPDIALGRFPVRNWRELTLIIEKTIEATRRIESGSEFLDHVGVWSQDQDGNGNEGETIRWLIDEIVANLPGQLIIDRLDKSELRTYEKGEAAAIEALLEGRGVILSMGTASATHKWDGFLDTMFGFKWSDPRLRMNESPLLPFALATSADIGNIDQTETKYAPHLGAGRPMMEEALLTPHAGPWAVFAPTRGSGFGASQYAIMEFMQLAYATGVRSAGWAATATVKNVSLRAPYYRDWSRSLVFLGDPALPLPGQILSTAGVQPVLPVPSRTFLGLRGPNPTRGSINLEYGITERAHIQVSVFDIRGRRLATLVNEIKESGEYTTLWDPRAGQGAEVNPGVYFAQLIVSGSVHGTIKVVWLP